MRQLPKTSNVVEVPALIALLKAEVTYQKQYKKLSIWVEDESFFESKLLRAMDNYPKAIACAVARVPILLMPYEEGTYYLNQRLTELLALDFTNMGGNPGRVEAALVRDRRNKYVVSIHFRVITDTCKEYTLEQFLDKYMGV